MYLNGVIAEPSCQLKIAERSQRTDSIDIKCSSIGATSSHFLLVFGRNEAIVAITIYERCASAKYNAQVRSNRCDILSLELPSIGAIVNPLHVIADLTVEATVTVDIDGRKK